MHRHRLVLSVALLTTASATLASQSPSIDLVQQARARLSANELDSADVLLAAALTSATERAESVNVYTWRAALFFVSGNDSATRVAFDQALSLDTALMVPALSMTSPRLPRILEEERIALRPDIVYTSGEVDEKPRKLSGPPIAYPPEFIRRQVRGSAMVGLIIDTLGHAQERSIDIIATTDSAVNGAIRAMLLSATFAPGRRHGKKVRTLTELAIDLVPGTPPNATSLVTAARGRLAVHETDNALALLKEALDPMTRATEGERVYAQLVEGIAWKDAGRDTLSREAFDSALAGYRQLTARGVELAPFLKRLADSVRLARAGRGPGTLGTPAMVEAVDSPPVPISHPAITYPPEMQALRVGGTVVVEARVDATGHVQPGTVRVVQSPNPGLEHEAMRVVSGAVYKPARRGGHAVAVLIRQPITFAPY